MEEQPLVSPCANALARCSARELPQVSGGVDFERLYKVHKRRVYSLCWHMVRNNAEAEDLTQEVFIQVFRKIGTYRGDAAFTTWLHRVAVNVALMRLRKKSYTGATLRECVDSADVAAPGREALTETSLSLSRGLESLDLERAIAQLPPGFRRAVLLHDVQGYGHHEIGRMTGVTVGTSKSQLHKARLRLRDFLNGSSAHPPAKKRRSSFIRANRTKHPAGSLSPRRPLVLTPQGGRLASAPAISTKRIDPAGTLQDEESEFSEEVTHGKVKCA